MCEMHFHHYLVYKKIQKTIDSYNIVSLENQKKKHWSSEYTLNGIKYLPASMMIKDMVYF